MWIKIAVLVAMAAVLVNLFIALFHLNRGGPGDSRKTLRSLAWRLGISIALVIFLYVAASLGWITPHGMPRVEAPAAPAAR
jgi:Flp pilus assembly protein protease CpaA